MNPTLTRLNLAILFAVAVALFLLVAAVFTPDAVNVQSESIRSNVVTARAPAAPPAWGGCYHVVRAGQNLFRIGLLYGVSYYYLAVINHIPNPNYIYAGAVLAVPCGRGARPPVPRGCAPSQNYIVKGGDNLFRIAVNYGSSVDLLRSANSLYGRVLRPNMRLIVPCPGSFTYPRVGTPAPTQQAPSTQPTAAPTSSVTTRQINILGDRFGTNPLTIRAGVRVVWANQDPDRSSHTILSGTPEQPVELFSIGPIPAGGRAGYTFAEAGVYSYYSKEKPELRGTITVNP